MKPILENQTSFDARFEHIFDFSANASIKSTRLIISKNIDNSVIYDATISSTKYKYIMPANSITNGITYNAYIYVTDVNNVLSEASDRIVFTCYTAPTFEIISPTINEIATYSSYEVRLNYTQAEKELLSTYKIFLFDKSDNIISESNLLYANNGLAYTITDLEDDHLYFVKATGTTVHGMTINTDKIKFTVKYKAPYLSPIITVENEFDKGRMKITSAISAVLGETVKTPIYIDGNKIDLRADAVKYLSGYVLKDDFAIKINAKNLKENSIILTLIDVNGAECILYYISKNFTGISGKRAMLELWVNNKVSKYVTISPLIPTPNETSILSISIKREGSLYSVKLEVQ